LLFLGLWNLIKKLLKKDIGNPLNKNLLEEGINFYSQFIKPNDLVFDVGANYGNRVEIFQKLNAKIVAIEPQRKCVDYLASKFKNITIENIGLGSKNEFKTFYEADSSVLSTFSSDYIEKVKNTRHKTSIWKKSIEIEIKTLEMLIEKYGEPKFIKVDVEGFELEVFKGLKHKIGVVSFEYNIPELQVEMIACMEQLNSIGYELFNFSKGETLLMNEKWLTLNDFLLLLDNKEINMSNFGDIYVK
jgi:FkbM family methyltransferase